MTLPDGKPRKATRVLAPVVAGPAPLSHSTQQALGDRSPAVIPKAPKHPVLAAAPSCAALRRRGDRAGNGCTVGSRPGYGAGACGGVPGTGLQEDKRQRCHRHDREEHGHSQRTEAEQLVDEQNRGGEDRHDDEGRQGPDHRPSRPARHHHLTRRTPHQET